MKNLFLLLVLVFVYALAAAQKPLTNSRVSGKYTYIYAVSDAGMEQLYHNKAAWNDKMLTRPIDSVLTDKYSLPHLKPGNYLKVYAVENKLSYNLIENHSAFLKMLNNHLDLRFVLLDTLGAQISNAQVWLNNKKINYDVKTHLYSYNRSRHDAVLKVVYQGISNYFTLAHNNESRGYKPHFWRWLGYYSPFKYIWRPIRNLFRPVHSNNNKNNGYTGYLVFNKPMYKPNDTVKFKAYVFNIQTHAAVLQKRLQMRLGQAYYGNENKVIGTVDSYRDGAFESQFVLNDSLKLQLDQNYFLTLSDTLKKVKDGNEVFVRGSFRYEDYELKSVKFTARADKEEHSPGNPVALYYKATDENNLPVPDGKVELTLLTSNATDYHNNHVFVPDTLWHHTLTLDPVGETKLVIPDSIFSKANVSYQVFSKFSNSNNEVQTQNTRLEYTDEEYKIITRLDADTLKINYKVHGVETSARATVTAQNTDLDNVSVTHVTLPAKIVINPNMAEYDIKTDSASEDAELKHYTANISATAYRTADSVFVSVNNPRHIPFWYTVFGGNKIIDSGNDKTLLYKKAYKKEGNVFFLLNWIWAGEEQQSEQTIVYQDHLLSINVRQPLTVSPGEQVQMEVNVKDAKGNPVSNADLTAYSATTKFQNYRTPTIPYFGKYYPVRKMLAPLTAEGKNQAGAFALNWQRWGRQMGLDSIVYFKFTHPKDFFSIVESAPDSLTQIAPFVVKDGNILPIYLLYIDGRPVYFNQSEQLQRYSFKVSPGKHLLRLRTQNSDVVLDNVDVPAFKKLILSINADTLLNKKAKFIAMPDTLTQYEAGVLNKYMTRIVNNFDWEMATLTQEHDVILLNPATSNFNYHRYNGNNSILAGPLLYNYADFAVHGEQARTFLVEPGYSFEFLPGLIKQKSVSGRYPFNTQLLSNTRGQQYNQYPLTNIQIDTLWQQYLDERSHTMELFPRQYERGENLGRLIIGIEGYTRNNEALKKQPLIKNIIAYRYDDVDYMNVYPGNSSMLGNLKAGNYRLLFLLQGNSYYVAENIIVRAHGQNYYKIVFKVKPADSVSNKIAAVINSRSNAYGANAGQDAQSLKEAFNDAYLDRAAFKNKVTGQVFSADDKQGIPGVTVKVKGTNHATVTDAKGRFSISVPDKATLVVMFIGYESKEVTVSNSNNINVTLKVSSRQLSEVVVVGYGTERRSMSMASVSSINTALAGSVPGIQIRLRGNASINGAVPLYVIDGVIVESGMAGIDAANIADVSVLKSEAATAIYGSRGANGVVIITTKKSATGSVAGTDVAQQQMLRTRFSDYAFWQPKLTTDAQGNAKFAVTFPDDITNWRTTVIGVAGTQTGIAEGSIKAYKSLSANFVSPQFAVKGDVINPIGKVINYTADAVNVNRVFKYNGQIIKQGALSVKSSLIDTFKVNAAGTDSLHFEYTIKKDNGYFDGERRSIPLFEQGVLETKGTFAYLEKDTTITLKFDPKLGLVTFRAEASVLPVLLEETERLRNYEYLCNEQLASKLKGLLLQKRIAQYLAKPFKWDKNITELIKKLQDSRRTDGIWGWWKDTDEELWISLHATEALIEAGQQGYATNINKSKLIDYLVYRVNAYTSTNKLDAISLLIKLGGKADYAQLLADYQNQWSKKYKPSPYEKMRLMMVKQQAGLPIALDSLTNTSRNTMFGNLYWGDDNYRFFDNSIQLSVMAYRIYKNAGNHQSTLVKIRNYLLEQRQADGWRNTYESSLILEIILPDLLTGSKLPQQQVVTLSGDKSEVVTKFPYTATLPANSKLTVAKTGNLPVYVTGYQKFWNGNPQKVSKDFTVNTWFEKAGDKITNLKGGQAATLQAEVTARADADFVMIEIPIPAGCSYDSKDQPYWGNEVHREYFKNKVSIFCRKLKQRKYNFTVKLMPRYSGTYNLNPAKAEMMYFPVFYGREGIKQVQIN